MTAEKLGGQVWIPFIGLPYSLQRNTHYVFILHYPCNSMETVVCSFVHSLIFGWNIYSNWPHQEERKVREAGRQADTMLILQANNNNLKRDLTFSANLLWFVLFAWQQLHQTMWFMQWAWGYRIFFYSFSSLVDPHLKFYYLISPSVWI